MPIILLLWSFGVLRFLVRAVAEFVAENGEHRAFVDDTQAGVDPAEADFVVALAGFGLFDGFHDDGFENATRGGRRDDGIAHAFNVEFRAGEAGERAFDAEADGIGGHFRDQGCRTLRKRVVSRRASKD